MFAALHCAARVYVGFVPLTRAPKEIHDDDNSENDKESRIQLRKNVHNAPPVNRSTAVRTWRAPPASPEFGARRSSRALADSNDRSWIHARRDQLPQMPRRVSATRP